MANTALRPLQNPLAHPKKNPGILQKHHSPFLTILMQFYYQKILNQGVMKYVQSHFIK